MACLNLDPPLSTMLADSSKKEKHDDQKINGESFRNKGSKNISGVLIHSNINKLENKIEFVWKYRK